MNSRLIISCGNVADFSPWRATCRMSADHVVFA